MVGSHHTLAEWRRLESSERAMFVALFRLQGAVSMHEQDAMRSELGRRQARAQAEG